MHSNEQTIKRRTKYTGQTKERNPMTDLAERVGRKGDIYKERKPRLHFDAPGQPLLKPDLTSPTVLFSIASFGEGGHHSPQQLIGVVLHALALRLQVQQLPYSLHGQIVLVIQKRGKRVL